MRLNYIRSSILRAMRSRGWLAVPTRVQFTKFLSNKAAYSRGGEPVRRLFVRPNLARPRRLNYPVEGVGDSFEGFLGFVQASFRGFFGFFAEEDAPAGEFDPCLAGQGRDVFDA